MAHGDAWLPRLLFLEVLAEDRSDPVDHLVRERWQFINLRTECGMLVRSSRNGTARMDVSRFDGLMAMTNVAATLLRVVVPIRWRKSSMPHGHRMRRIDISAVALSRSLQGGSSSPRVTHEGATSTES
jgi:hypothetical protein